MFIWIGADVDSQLGEIKELTKKVEDEIGFVHSNFTLPLHISFKISFPVDNKTSGEVIDFLLELYKTFKPFYAGVKGIEYLGNIAWIRMCECEELNSISEKLNKALFEKYSVGIHPYDCDYQFHTTLFMDDDAERVGAAYEAVKDAPLPEKLLINKLVVGTSETGELGSYKVVKSIELKDQLI